MTSSRRYIKRIWRVPKDRGPVEYLATLICKSLIKHGWPAKWTQGYDPASFCIQHHEHGWEYPPDFERAVEIAIRIAARTHRVDISTDIGCVTFNRLYRVTPGGVFRQMGRE